MKHLREEDLNEALCVVVANIKPVNFIDCLLSDYANLYVVKTFVYQTNLRGVKSCGMVLAATNKEGH